MGASAFGDRDYRQHKLTMTQMRKLIDVNQDILEPPEPVHSVVVGGSNFGALRSPAPRKPLRHAKQMTLPRPTAGAKFRGRSQKTYSRRLIGSSRQPSTTAVGGRLPHRSVDRQADPLISAAGI
jgi:hypothetical protein